MWACTSKSPGTHCDGCCSEMAPPHLRGRFNQLYQIVLTLFILVAQVINLIINLTGAVRWGWRLSLGFAFVPSSILFLGGVFLPDSPNSLLERGHIEQVSVLTSTNCRDLHADRLVLHYCSCCCMASGPLSNFAHACCKGKEDVKHADMVKHMTLASAQPVTLLLDGRRGWSHATSVNNMLLLV